MQPNLLLTGVLGVAASAVVGLVAREDLSRWTDRGKVVTLVGPPNSGKTALARGLARRPLADVYVPTGEPRRFDVSDGEVKLAVWDLGGSREHVLNHLSKVRAAAVILVVNLERFRTEASYRADLDRLA